MQNDYYNNYWADGEKHTGRKQGYARYFVKWMDQEIGGFRSGHELTKGLEAGCGDASFTMEFSKYFHETHAIDISTAQIEHNKKHYKNIHFQAHDLSQPLPFPDAFFDIVWCSEVLEHLFDPYAALCEFRRTIRPGGKLLVTVPYHGGIKKILIALFKWDHHFDPEYPHIRFFTKNTLERISRKAGFSTFKFQTCGMSKPLRDMIIPTNLLMRAQF